MTNKTIDLDWKVNTPGLLREICNNPGVSILSKPITIFGNILHEVAGRSAEINDPELNALMCRLALYEVSDPNHPNYDQCIVDSAYKNAKLAKESK